MLLQVTNDLAKTKSLDEALETLVKITTSTIGAERGTIFLMMHLPESCTPDCLR